jgi:DNA replication licensing factor MCM2
VNWQDLWAKENVMAEWVGDAPAEMIPFLDEILLKEVTREANFPDYTRIAPELYVRFTDLPLTESLRDLRYNII